MELLDKGMLYKQKLKQLKSPILIICSSLFGFAGIYSLKIAMDWFVLGCISAFLSFGFGIGLPIFMYIKIKNALEEIDRNTVKFENYRVRAEIVSKSQKSTTNIHTLNHGVYGGTTHAYMVGIRTDNGLSGAINNEDLFMQSREGEFVDIVVKRKLDKIGNVLDSSYIPLINTIRATK